MSLSGAPDSVRSHDRPATSALAAGSARAGVRALRVSSKGDSGIRRRRIHLLVSTTSGSSAASPKQASHSLPGERAW